MGGWQRRRPSAVLADESGVGVQVRVARTLPCSASHGGPDGQTGDRRGRGTGATKIKRGGGLPSCRRRRRAAAAVAVVVVVVVNGSENTRSSTKRLREGATGAAMRLCLGESGAERQKKSAGGAGERRGRVGVCVEWWW